jgi:hypothetical protein
MSFIRPIEQHRRYGLDVTRVRIPIVVFGAAGEVGPHPFVFDTGCELTTVSEDVAAVLGLPPGGTAVHVRGATGAGTGRLVSVTFRFPPDAVSGLLDAAVSSMWFVVTGRTRLTLLSLRDVHQHYQIGTDDTDMYFTNR